MPPMQKPSAKHQPNNPNPFQHSKTKFTRGRKALLLYDRGAKIKTLKPYILS